LAPAFTPHWADRPPPNCAGTADPHPPHDHGESTLGSAKDPGGAGETWIQGFSYRQVYATNPSSRAIFRARVPGRLPWTVAWLTLICPDPAGRGRRASLSFLRQHGSEIWACDFFCVRTITFRTLYVFFVIDHASRQVLHVHVAPTPTAWVAQQMVECCAWDRKPPGFLVHDRDGCYGATFHRRVRNIGIAQVRTPFRSPRANAIAERWVRSVRTECLDHVFIFNERHLQGVLEYVGYFNDWRPHRSLGQRAPCAPGAGASHRSAQAQVIIAVPVLGGLHHVGQQAA
jgi:transposase InsO family protein